MTITKKFRETQNSNHLGLNGAKCQEAQLSHTYAEPDKIQSS